jgi:hypothetical protein
VSRAWLLGVLAAVALSACSASGSAPPTIGATEPTPRTPNPTGVEFAPAGTANAAPGAAATATAVAESAEPVNPASLAPGELEAAFLSSVDDLVAQTADLSRQPCGDLSQAATANPALFPSLSGYANTLKRVGASDPDLDTDTVKSALSDLDKSMGLLQGALSLCGINPS